MISFLIYSFTQNFPKLFFIYVFIQHKKTCWAVIFPICIISFFIVFFPGIVVGPYEYSPLWWKWSKNPLFRNTFRPSEALPLNWNNEQSTLTCLGTLDKRKHYVIKKVSKINHNGVSFLYFNIFFKFSTFLTDTSLETKTTFYYQFNNHN